MASSLLATKIRIPPQTHQTVPRPRLVAALERGIQVDSCPLILVAAPAGYGKTTLLTQWARASQARVAWLSLGAEDNDPDRFFRYLLAAWEDAQPGIGESPLGLLLGAMQPDRDAVLTAFINAACDIPEQTVFVLDDAHLIEEASIHEGLAFLLDHLPPSFHFVLAGRAEPPLPLARYRARQQLLELRSDDLHLSLAETTELVNRSMRLDLTEDEIASLHDQLEGWAAGLQLASLTLQRRRVADRRIVSGRHRFIADYLREEVLPLLPAERQAFLLQTSILDELCGSLCDAVTGGADGQEILESLERENLFLVPQDDRREWFRYHRLFADFLREELRRRRPHDVAALHRRAAGWFLDHELPDQAFHHALAGSDRDLAFEIVERYMSLKLHGGELRELQGWIDAIPDAWLAANPLFGLVRAAVLMFTGEIDACVRCVDDVERRLASQASGDAASQQAKITAFRCFVACFDNDLERAEAAAVQALRGLAADDHFYRGDVYHALGETYGRHGRWEQARAHYLKALEFSAPPEAELRSAHVYGALADLDLRQGRLRDAGTHWRQALAAVQEPENRGRVPLPVIGWVYLRLAELHYERDELAESWDYLTRGLQYAELGGDARTLIAGFLAACRLKLTAGDGEAAAEYLERARPLVEPASFSEWTSRFERCQLELWVAQDRLRAALDWVDAALRHDSLKDRPESAPVQLAMARVLIVEGDALARERALALLGHVLQTADAEGRVGIQIEALALHALATWRAGERAGAMIVLERALRLAEPEGYARLFADFGLPMARLLQEAHERGVMPDYVSHLLAACGARVAHSASSGGMPPEALSAREEDVLRLMAAGLTNREIAAELFISPETVKKHTGSIYAKLGVDRRTRAVARARELHLLDDAG
jgi:LuxR family maltose regulon positive regulatory protein